MSVKLPSKKEKTGLVERGCKCICNLIVAQWFLVGMLLAICVAALAPSFGKKGGPLRPEISVKYVLVPIIFFCSGLTLKRDKLKGAIIYCKLNLLIQGFNLIFYPAVTFGQSAALRYSDTFSKSITEGLVIMGCVPCTVSMCFILTSACKANEAIAVINATIGNLLGIFVTPALLLLLLGSESQINVLNTLQKLALTLLLPIFVGQLVQLIFGMVSPRVKGYVGKMNKCILIIIVYVSFCDTFSSDVELGGASFVGLLALVVATYLFMFGTSVLFFNLPCLNIAHNDRPPAWFCSTQKTVAMGLPLINIIFEGRTDIGIIAIPLLIVHPTQLIVGTLLIPTIERWLSKHKVEEQEGVPLSNHKDDVGHDLGDVEDGTDKKLNASSEEEVLISTRDEKEMEQLVEEADKSAGLAV